MTLRIGLRRGIRASFILCRCFKGDAVPETRGDSAVNLSGLLACLSSNFCPMYLALELAFDGEDRLLLLRVGLMALTGLLVCFFGASSYRRILRRAKPNLFSVHGGKLGTLSK